MSSAFTARRPRGRARLLGLLFGVAVLILVGSAPALAAVEWTVKTTHGPQNMVPGRVGQYVVLAQNVGDTDADASVDPIIVTDTLPPGVTALDAVGGGWSCSGVGTGVVRCESTSLFIRPPGTSAVFRGAVPPIRITVDVPPGISGVHDNVVEISGGGAPSPATSTEPTPFNDAPSPFGIRSFSADAYDGVFPAGGLLRQAGSHPVELRVDLTENLTLGHDADSNTYFTKPAGDTRTLQTLLPPGAVGDPLVTPRCPAITLNDTGTVDKGACPANTQVGIADFELQDGAELVLSGISGGIDGTLDVPLYNMVPPPGAAAAFAFSVNGSAVWIVARLAIDESGRYAVVANVENTTQAFQLRAVRLTMWGVPGDPIHDPLRQDPTQPDPSINMGTTFRDAPIRPFLTLPSRCDAAAAAAVLTRADSWQNPGQFTPWVAGGAPTAMEGCDDPRFRFRPTITVQPESRDAKTPAALDVELSVPQKDATVTDATLLYHQSGDDRAIATPPLKSAVVQLPAGVSVSPSSADGLAACSPLQIGLGTMNEPTCPDASKIGSVTIDTPLLAEQLSGDVFFATQNDNPFGTMLAIYIVARGPGVVIKLAGKVEPGPDGRLLTTFDNNPELPFSKMRLRFLGGSRAPLAMPTACGTYTSTGQLGSWNAELPTVEVSDSFVIDRNCATGFDPGFTAGTTNPVAGKDSTVVTRFTRSDNDEELSEVDVTLPLGVLGRIADVDLCDDGPANAGACGEGSRIGTITVGAGPGPDPFFITNGRAYMTGPYKGAPFGMSFVVPAKAGPIDLGNVIVRAAVHVDRLNAQLRVVSDPLPTILKGIPLKVRVVDVKVDRPGFTFNPTNCSEMSSSATLRSTTGTTRTKSGRFQVSDCAALPFKPRMSIRVGGRGRTQRGRTTPLEATVRMTPGQANLRGVRVTLPTAINARLNVINRACTRAEFDAGNCAKAKAGSAVAVTPLLRDPLQGDAYFVRNGRPLPDLMVALRGQVAFDLAGKITIPRSKFLSTNFDTVPDVPITKFTLKLISGRNGSVGNAANLCTTRSRRARVNIAFTAQSGKLVERSQKLAIAGCRARARRGRGARRGRRGR